MEQLAVALIGAGAMGQLHAATCASLPHVRLAWVVDTDLARATRVANETGAQASTDIAQAVADTDVAAVLVAAPTPEHRRCVELAAAHGKHLFVEKPIARTLDDARAMVATCAAHHVRLMVGHVVRFFPEYARIKALLDAGEIGRVGVARTSRLNLQPRGRDNWYADLELSGGPVVDMMIHDLDTLRWYFGEAVRVYARGLSGRQNQRLDYALAVLRFAGGEIAHCEASWAHPDGFRTSIELAGERGLLAHSSVDSTPLRWERQADDDGGAPFIPRDAGGESPYRVELRHFFDRLRDGAPFQVDGDEALLSLRLALAVLDAAQTGAVQTLSASESGGMATYTAATSA